MTVTTKLCEESSIIIDRFNDRSRKMYGHIQSDEDRSIKYGMRDFNGVPTCFIRNEADPDRNNFLVISAGTNDAFLDDWYEVKVDGTLMFNFATFDAAWAWSAEITGTMACRVSMETIRLDVRVAFSGNDRPGSGVDEDTMKKIAAMEGDTDIEIHLIESAFWFENEADAVTFRMGYDEIMLRSRGVDI